MTIRLHNTLSHAMETFVPVDTGVVRMYHCGPTVYDFAHIGNFRSFLLADLLRRFFEFTGYSVHQVMNITDVGHMTEDQLADGGGQDKMELAAQRLKLCKKQGAADVENPDDPYQVARYFTQAFLDDARLLRMKIVDQYPAAMPHATANVPGMIRIVEKLIQTGHAYVAGDGAVYYDVAKFPAYGKLSGNTLEHLCSGAGGRVQSVHQAGKRNPHDFLLWKPDAKHLMRWPSPWGEGYPGWHIECSAMAMDTLGVSTLDIHTGGEDNIFPHHECEIAQSTGYSGKPFANYWLHARHLLVEGEKMSKSKGNFYTVRDLLARHVDPAVLRYELMRTHYRVNANFTAKGLEDSEKAVRKLRQFAGDAVPSTKPGPVEKECVAALSEDLNMSQALGVVFKWINDTPNPSAEDRAAMWRLDAILGVLEAGPVVQSSQEAEFDAKCRCIDEARAAKDYARSDALRDELASAGIEIQITREGTKWRQKVKMAD